MRGQLVTVTAQDHVRLHGFLAVPDSFGQRQASGLVFLHGLGGNFYGSPLLSALAQRAFDDGRMVALANTRGHDLLNWTPAAGRSRLLGASTENVAEAIDDVQAWVELLRSHGCRRMAIVGHSLGAIKALYAQAMQPDADVSTVIALSPTRLNHRQFIEGPKGAEFSRSFEHARQLATQGQGDQLIQIEFPFATWMSAAGFVNKYGPEDYFDWFRFVDRIDVPSLVTFGSRELDEHPAFFGLSNALQAAHRDARWPALTIEIIPNADHFYVACYRQVAERLAEWLIQMMR